MLLRDVTRSPVVHYHVRVIYRDVLDTSIELADRIASRLHHLADETIRFRDGSSRVVHKLRLDPAPLRVEARRIFG